ncbi:MAG: hypothetical protein EBR81_15130, partial [Proteobacteria bacterium]|nr:hypothetical protein [Pseudomonadota bacterium]
TIHNRLIIGTNLTIAIDELVEEVRGAIRFKEHGLRNSKCLATILNSLDIRQNPTVHTEPLV